MRLSSSSVMSVRPWTRCHFLSIGRSTRSAVPEFTVVVPPTVLPRGSRMKGTPTVMVWAASRYIFM